MDSAYADSADTALTADSATSATSAGTASSADDADLLDGMDSAAFAPATAEGWHNVAAAGQAQPAFIRQTCSDSNPFDYSPKVWANYDSRVHNTAAFYKDPFGMVHLKGPDQGRIPLRRWHRHRRPHLRDDFKLPTGYRPAIRTVLATLTYRSASGTNSVRVARISIDRNSLVWAAENSNRGWLSLDGISFRAEG